MFLTPYCDLTHNKIGNKNVCMNISRYDQHLNSLNRKCLSDSDSAIFTDHEYETKDIIKFILFGIYYIKLFGWFSLKRRNWIIFRLHRVFGLFRLIHGFCSFPYSYFTVPVLACLRFHLDTVPSDRSVSGTPVLSAS